MESLPLSEQCSEAEAEFLRLLYDSKLKKYQEPTEKQAVASCGVMGVLVTDRLSGNLDMQVSEAERLYYNCDYHKCFSLTERYVNPSKLIQFIYFLCPLIDNTFILFLNYLIIIFQYSKQRSLSQWMLACSHRLFSRVKENEW